MLTLIRNIIRIKSGLVLESLPHDNQWYNLYSMYSTLEFKTKVSKLQSIKIFFFTGRSETKGDSESFLFKTIVMKLAAAPRHSLLLYATTFLLVLLFLSAAILLYRIGKVQDKYSLVLQVSQLHFLLVPTYLSKYVFSHCTICNCI